MKFNSIEFWLFFSFVIVSYRFLPQKSQNRLLLVAGYVFYSSWDWRFLPLLWISTVVDYILSRILHRSSEHSTRVVVLAGSIAVNLGVLGIFKYYDFFTLEIVRIANYLGADFAPCTLGLALPVGISFYSLQKLGYLLDVYYSRNEPPANIFDFALYTCFFPIILSGPIERSTQLMPQILAPRAIKQSDISEALYHIFSGLFRKVVLADNLAPIVNIIFSTDPKALSGPECLAGMYLYTFQIYFDFSGYSHIAQGVAKLMGFDVMWNFKMPYFASTPSEFWNRWHISLSSWIRDYLYIPLGGNRLGKVRTLTNLTITMLLVGLWHGAAWNFVVWGMFHGCLLVAYRIIELWGCKRNTASISASCIGHCLKVFILFNLIAVGWLLFRSDSILQASVMLWRGLTDFSTTNLFYYSLISGAVYVLPMIIFEAWIFLSGDLLIFSRKKWYVQGLVYGLVTIFLMIFQPVGSSEFIYFRF